MHCNDLDWVNISFKVCNARIIGTCGCYGGLAVWGRVYARLNPRNRLVSNPCCLPSVCADMVDGGSVQYVKIKLKGVWPNGNCYGTPYNISCAWRAFPTYEIEKYLSIPLPPPGHRELVTEWAIGLLPTPIVSGGLVEISASLIGDTAKCCAGLSTLQLGPELPSNAPTNIPIYDTRCRYPWLPARLGGLNAIYPPGLLYPFQYTHWSYGTIPPSCWTGSGTEGGDGNSRKMYLRVVDRGPEIGAPDPTGWSGRMGGPPCVSCIRPGPFRSGDGTDMEPSARKSREGLSGFDRTPMRQPSEPEDLKECDDCG